MKLKRLSITLAALALLLGATIATAANQASDKVPDAADHTPGSVKKAAPATSNADSKAKAKTKAKAKVKLVDINGANKAALMKLPGITAADADKIIANRPYGSKTWLATNKVISETAFYAIKPLIEAKQPFKTAAENVAFYEKLKKEKAAKP
jgi:DNA uptake protein ComE-like DNA-binding protein